MKLHQKLPKVTDMFRVTPELFMNLLLSGKKVEIHIYCEDNIVYSWESYNSEHDEVEFSYLVSPQTAKQYDDFIENLKNNCPLLLELV
jgi:hypothetical protein